MTSSSDDYDLTDSDQDVEGDIGVSSGRVGPTGPGQVAPTGVRDTSEIEPDPDADLPPEQSPAARNPSPTASSRRLTTPPRPPLRLTTPMSLSVRPSTQVFEHRGRRLNPELQAPGVQLGLDGRAVGGALDEVGPGAVLLAERLDELGAAVEHAGAVVGGVAGRQGALGDQ